MSCSDMYAEILSFVDNITLYNTLTVSIDFYKITRETKLYKELSRFKYLDKKEIWDKAVIRGNLFMVQWIYKFQKIKNQWEIDNTFSRACIAGHLEVAKWLYNLKNVDIHVYEDAAFRVSCL